jgi:cysteine-rich repeat protein
LLTCGLLACGSNNSAKPGIDAGGKPGIDAGADPGLGDAAVADASVPDAAVPLVEVHGVATALHVSSPTTTSSALQDLSTYDLQAFVPDAAPAGFRVIEAASKTTKFAIPGVPGGSYYLRVIAPGDPVPHFYQTTSRTIELGTTAFGRVDGPFETQPTTLTLHLTGADPVQFGDAIFIDSFATAGESFPVVTDHQTALDPLDVPWRDMGGVPLLDAAKGDELIVSHQREVDGPGPGSFQKTIVDAFSTTTVTLVDGATTDVTGTFAVPDVTGDQTFQLAPALYRQGHDVPIHQPLEIIARLRAGLTGAPDHDRAARNADELGPSLVSLLQVAGQSQQPITDVVSFRDPFPASWQRFVSATPHARWSFAAREPARPVSYVASTIERLPVSATVKIAPQFAAPHAIKVAGVDASQARAVPFDGAHAVAIGWAPVTGVSHYTVVAMQLTTAGGSAVLAPVATFDTTTSTATMPPSLFTLGGSYVFAVATVVDPSTDYASGVLRRLGFPLSIHETVTARLLFASSCGNGTVDAAFEQCDSGGVATAACNPDCTRPSCGDGFANVAAGELCDDAGDSLVCNANCTPAACGDGHVHVLAGQIGGEKCDDGNLADHDGCSSDCLVEAGFACTGEPSVCRRAPASARRAR